MVKMAFYIFFLSQSMQQAAISCGRAAFFRPHCLERPFPSPHLKGAGRSNSRLRLSAVEIRRCAAQLVEKNASREHASRGSRLKGAAEPAACGCVWTVARVEVLRACGFPIYLVKFLIYLTYEVLDSRAARGVHSGHRGNFGKLIQKGVPWDAAKPEGHAAPPHKC